MSDNLWAYGRAQHTPRTVRAGHCTWTDPDGEGNYDTECGNRFVVIQGTPSDNEMGWCCYCGREIKEGGGDE